MKIFLLLCLFCINIYAQLLPTDSQYYKSDNKFKNAGFENGRTSWILNGVTSNFNSSPFGKYSLVLNFDSVSDYIYQVQDLSQFDSIDGIVSIWAKTTGTGIYFAYYDGATSDAVQLNNDGYWHEYTIKKTLSNSATQGLKIYQNSATPQQVEIDSAYIGTFLGYNFSSDISSLQSQIASSIQTLNGVVGPSVNLALSNSGTAPNITTSSGIVTLNFPDSSIGGVTQGLLSNTDYNTFLNKKDYFSILPTNEGGTGSSGLGTGYVKVLANAFTTSSSINTSDLSGNISVANGGTSLSSLTSQAIIVGNGTNPPIGLTCSNTQIPKMSGGVWTCASDDAGGGGGGGLTTITTSAAIIANVNYRYILNSNGVSLQSITLPASATVGDRIELIGQGSSRFQILTNASASAQKIYQASSVSNTSSSSAIQVYLSSTAYGTVDLVATDTNTWEVADYINGDVIGDYNFWGNSSNGTFNSSGNTNISTSLDGECTVLQYSSFKNNTGHTWTPTNRTRCTVIYVNGTFDNAGTMELSGLGASVNPNNITTSDNNFVGPNGICFRRKTSGGSTTDSATNNNNGGGLDLYNAEINQRPLDANNKGILRCFPKVGGLGASGKYASGSQQIGNTGGTAAYSAGGGGSGGSRNLSGGECQSGAGGDATVWSGGSASGGCLSVGANQYGTDASDYGGAGTNGVQAGSVGTGNTGGGAGNNGGLGANGGGSGQNGTGHTLWIIAKTFINSGTINVKGKNGGAVTIEGGGGGGGSGGGIFHVFWANSYSNTGTISAAGGIGGSSTGSAGGNGGAGVVGNEQVSL